MTKDATALHDAAIVIDAVCPLLMDHRHLELYRRGGATAVAPTVGGSENAETALRTIGRWIKLIRNAGDLALVRRAADIEAAKRDRRLGIILHFQGTDPIEDDVDLIDAYKSLGVGMVQLTYNVRNRVGDGCEEPGDAGLSRFGRDVVKRLNEARIVVDCSHTGYRTTMDRVLPRRGLQRSSLAAQHHRRADQGGGEELSAAALLLPGRHRDAGGTAEPHAPAARARLWRGRCAQDHGRQLGPRVP